LILSPEIILRLSTAAPAEIAQDDAFWTAIRGKYRLVPDYINLENGYYSMQAEPVLEQFIDSIRKVNYGAARYMRTVRTDDKNRVRNKLAALAGCSPEELIITRNTTESLDTVISGYDWKAGEEAVMAAQDYGAMLDHFKLMARRHGLVNKVVQVPPHPRSDDEVVQVYANAITPQTRLLWSATWSTSRARSCRSGRSRRWRTRAAWMSWSTAPTRSPTSTSRSPTSAPTTTARAFTSGWAPR
jgi:hypothetical protein